MTHQRTLTVTALLSILLFSLHWSDEIARGIEPGTIDRTWGGLLILFVWLYGALAVPERRLGLAIILLGSVLASGISILHMQGRGLVGGRIATDSSGVLFWVWTNVALGASGMISLALALHALWNRTARGHRPHAVGDAENDTSANGHLRGRTEPQPARRPAASPPP